MQIKVSLIKCCHDVPRSIVTPCSIPNFLQNSVVRLLLCGVHGKPLTFQPGLLPSEETSECGATNMLSGMRIVVESDKIHDRR